MYATLRAAALTISFCLTTSSSAATERKIGSLLTDGDDGCTLVAGEVTLVKDFPGKVSQATIKIVQVYSGPKSLKGTAFVQATTAEGSDFGGSVAIPLLKVRETGLWIMGTDTNTGNPVWSEYFRKAHSTHYDRKVEWAEQIERLVKLKVAERLKLAKEICGHKTPEVAQLGIEVLFGAYEPDAEAQKYQSSLRDFRKTS